MADKAQGGLTAAQLEAKKKSYKKSLYRGIELTQLMDLSTEKLVQLFRARQRRRFTHGIQHKYDRLIKKLREAKKKVVAGSGEKPTPVRTHLRNCIVVPEMVGSVVSIYGGKYWNDVEVKADMIGHYLAEFSMSYRQVRHGKLGVGATRSSKFTSLK